MALRVQFQHDKRHQIDENVVWVREVDFPWLDETVNTAGFPVAVDCLNMRGNVCAERTIVGVGRFVDLEPVGSGRKKDDVYLRLELQP